jgi:hypothetical protein
MEPVMEMVDALMPMVDDQAPEEVAWDHTDTEWETIPVSLSSSLVSTAATAVVVGKVPTKLTIHSMQQEVNKIMLMLEKTMECEWSERIEAKTLATVEHDVTIWKRRLANWEESLKWKVAALMEAEKGQSELRKTLEAKDTELTKV